jgi:hypothetical protein
MIHSLSTGAVSSPRRQSAAAERIDRNGREGETLGSAQAALNDQPIARQPLSFSPNDESGGGMIPESFHVVGHLPFSL